MGLMTSIKFFFEANNHLRDGNQPIYNEYIAIAVVIFFVNIMQLNEFFLWLGQKNTETFYHQFWSWMILFILVMQVLAFYLSSLPLRDAKLTPEANKCMDAFSGIALITGIYGLGVGLKEWGKLKTVPDCSSCRLHWNIVDKFRKHQVMFYLFFICYLLAGLMAIWVIFDDIGLGIVIGLFGICVITNYYTFGSLWCFLLLLLIILFGIFEKQLMPFVYK
jgi:hypothetical protein